MSLARFKRPLATADAHETAEQAAWTMRDQGVGCLVVTEKGRPIGIVTDRDLVVRLLAEGFDASAPVGEFATVDPLTVSIHDSIETVSACMRTHGVRRLPIVDDDGQGRGHRDRRRLARAAGPGPGGRLREHRKPVGRDRQPLR